jgi:hypothetical protein
MRLILLILYTVLLLCCAAVLVTHPTARPLEWYEVDYEPESGVCPWYWYPCPAQQPIPYPQTPPGTPPHWPLLPRADGPFFPPNPYPQQPGEPCADLFCKADEGKKS